ncbi:hypothetical protein MXB_2540 [Myxobolus squamalis]|nr:hypothetical protein MXB_2540 [Myxobolus squamalis]
MELCRMNKEKNDQISRLKPEIRDKIYHLYNKATTNKQKEMELLKILKKKENEIEIFFDNKLKVDGFLNVNDECKKLIDDLKSTVEEIEELIKRNASSARELEVKNIC